MASATVEDYVKRIYLLADQSDGDAVPIGRVAEALGVVPGTATTMMKALADADLVRYRPRQGVVLSKSGRALALHVLRRHRLLEQFLVAVLAFDWSEVHEEAERLEHALSDRLLERIDRYLGHPTEDPHGDPIPGVGGELTREAYETLVDCPLREPLLVARITDQDTEFLRYIGRAGLMPGVTIRVAERSVRAESVRMEVGTERLGLTLGLGAATKILVRPACADPAATDSAGSV